MAIKLPIWRNSAHLTGKNSQNVLVTSSAVLLKKRVDISTTLNAIGCQDLAELVTKTFWLFFPVKCAEFRQIGDFMAILQKI